MSPQNDPAFGFAAGADHFDRLFAPLWSPIGIASAEAAQLGPGQRVFDACCGSGASALRAAELVGAAGRVDAVDLAAPLLDRGRATAAARGLDGLRFTHADVLNWPAPPGGYDSVLCVLGIFFFPDMTSGTDRLVQLLRPSGRLTATIWARGAVDPLLDAFREAILPERPELAAQQRPVHLLETINTPETYADWLRARSLSSVEVRRHQLALPADPELLWSIVLGTALRAQLEPLPEPARDRVRERFADRLTAQGRAAVDFTALIGTGVR